MEVKMELYHDNFQNYKRYNIPFYRDAKEKMLSVKSGAQLKLADMIEGERIAGNV